MASVESRPYSSKGLDVSTWDSSICRMAASSPMSILRIASALTSGWSDCLNTMLSLGAPAKSNWETRKSANGLAEMPCLSRVRPLELRHVQKLLHRNFSLQFGKTPSEASVSAGAKSDIVLVATFDIELRRSHKRRRIAVRRS